MRLQQLVPCAYDGAWDARKGDWFSLEIATGFLPIPGRFFANLAKGIGSRLRLQLAFRRKLARYIPDLAKGIGSRLRLQPLQDDGIAVLVPPRKGDWFSLEIATGIDLLDRYKRQTRKGDWFSLEIATFQIWLLFGPEYALAKGIGSRLRLQLNPYVGGRSGGPLAKGIGSRLRLQPGRQCD